MSFLLLGAIVLGAIVGSIATIYFLIRAVINHL